jgi:Mg-chelatase subunit ChlD
MLSLHKLSPSQELALVFLVDGSGSVQEEDFAMMTSFITRTCQEAADKALGCKAAVIQFSNDARVELPLQDIDIDDLDKKLACMVRMNGGTNMQCALQRAGQLLKSSASADSARVVVLLTDGRVDNYQAKEARAMACRLADEQQHVQLFAFGVGQGVDRSELLYILCASGEATAEERYMDLCVREEAPW